MYFFFCYLPCLATITEETASGTLVPAAKNVIPITESGMFNVLPINYVNFLHNDKNETRISKINSILIMMTFDYYLTDVHFQTF